MVIQHWLEGWDCVREYGENRYSIQQSPGFQEVACIKDLKNDEMNDSMDAAARLIAAAPDLLNAAIKAIDLLAPIALHNVTMLDGDNRPAEVIELLSKVIMEARGDR